MPKLIRLYIVNVAIGFALALVFVSGLVWYDLGGLWHLITETEKGWLAFVMMVVFNGIVFASVQFGYAVMSMADSDNGPKSGTRQHLVGRLAPATVPAKIRAAAQRR